MFQEVKSDFKEEDWELGFSKNLSDKSNKNGHSSPGGMVRSIMDVFSFLSSGIVNTDAGDIWDDNSFIADLVFAERFRVSVDWEVFYS